MVPTTMRIVLAAGPASVRRVAAPVAAANHGMARATTMSIAGMPTASMRRVAAPVAAARMSVAAGWQHGMDGVKRPREEIIQLVQPAD